MAFQTVFKRYEIKYTVNDEQKRILLRGMAPFMKLDDYGKTTIRNIYFDTDNYRLIRRSMEKPVYKEKLRVRSYCLATPESNVFVELKKKYKSVVYASKEKELIDKLRVRNGNLEISVSNQETAVTEL